MCGIVGYIGRRKPLPVLMEGLRRLEYRGYDSAGIAVIGHDGQLEIRRATGKLHNLEEALRRSPVDGWYGIGHTRWATHGRPTEENAHPHRDCGGNVVVVHNGIIENYLELKQELAARGHVFRTETDTEIIPHLIEENFTGSLEEAVRRAVGRLRGLFAVAVVSRLDPGKIVAARQGPPVVIGVGEGEYFAASDIPAILHQTRDVFFLHDGDMAILTPEGVRLADFAGRPVQRPLSRILWEPVQAEKGGYRHFMLKEIYEQPRAVRDTILNRVGQESGRIFLDEMQISAEQFASFRSVKIVACGTSWHAALAGKFMIESLAKVPTEVDHGSEFRYRDPLVGPDTLTILDFAVRRDGGHAGGAAGGEAERFSHAGHLQRHGGDDGARGLGRADDACRPGDRRGFYESFLIAAGSAVPAGDVSGPGAGRARRGCLKASGS